MVNKVFNSHRVLSYVSDDKPSAAASAAHADPAEGGEKRVQQKEEEEAAVSTPHTLRQSHAPRATISQETPACSPLRRRRSLSSKKRVHIQTGLCVPMLAYHMVTDTY